LQKESEGKIEVKQPDALSLLMGQPIPTHQKQIQANEAKYGQRTEKEIKSSFQAIKESKVENKKKGKKKAKNENEKGLDQVIAIKPKPSTPKQSF